MFRNSLLKKGQNNIQTDGGNIPENPQFNNEGGFRGGMPQGDFGKMFGGASVEEEQKPQNFVEFVKYYSTPIASLALLILAFVFVTFYKRKRY